MNSFLGGHVYDLKFSISRNFGFFSWKNRSGQSKIVQFTENFYRTGQEFEIEDLHEKNFSIFFDKSENNLYFKKDKFTVRVLLDITEKTFNGEIQVKLRSPLNIFLPFANGQRFLNVTKQSKFEVYMSEEYSHSEFLGSQKIEIPENTRISSVQSSVDEMMIFAAVSYTEPSKLEKILIFRVKVDGKSLELLSSYSPNDELFDAVFDLQCEFEEESNPILVFSERYSKRVCSFIFEGKELRRFGTLETAVTTHDVTFVARTRIGYALADSFYNIWAVDIFEDFGVKMSKKSKCCSLI